jgi:2-haloacid dehalogenase
LHLAGHRIASEELNGMRDFDTVVFDLGGVLIDWNPRHLYRKLFEDDIAGMERFLSDVCSPSWNERQDAGRSFDEAVADLLPRHADQAHLIAAFRDRWSEMLGGEIPGTVAVLSELKAAGVRLYALTNWSRETFPVARTRFDFLQSFDGILVSGQEMLVKPDPAIFELLFSRFDIQPKRSVFIDDSQRNVQCASTTGMQAVLFTDAEALRTALIGLGLPVASGCASTETARGPG